jgi:hypothetical protein
MVSIDDTARDHNQGATGPEPALPYDEVGAFCARLRFDWAAGLATPCAMWVAARTRTGYGEYSRHGRPCFVHRLSYEWAYGPPPPVC